MQIVSRRLASLALAVAGMAACAGAGASAEDFNWKQFDGQSINFLSSNHPWANAVVAKKAEFKALTGIDVRVDTFQEEQMRQRLVTTLQSRSPDVDIFMSLKSREGQQYANAGWYADLKPLLADSSKTAKNYDFGDLSAALVKGEEFGGKLDGIPLNIEGPVLYLRKDVFERCKVPLPTKLDEIAGAAQKLKACDATITPFVTRGAKGALAYTFSNFLHNAGAEYFNGGKPAMCAGPAKAALDTYVSLLKDYGPPGVVNYSFLQIRELFGQGKAAMAFESSNEFGPIINFPGRSADTTVMLLPPGSGGSRPTVIGWGLSLSAYSKHLGPAWLFAQWATSKDMQGKLAVAGIAPPRASVADSPEYAKWLSELQVRGEWDKALKSMAANGTSEVGPPMEQQPEARDILGEAVQRMLLGQANADQACADIDAKWEALLAKEHRN
jgi:multiple sugar transport system substrate-binding protein